MMAGKQAVLLVAHGSPDSASEVPEFMKAVTGGRPLPPAVIEEVQRRYAEIGHSPLREITEEQARLLQERLGMPVFVGMRNWKPFIVEALGKMQAEGVKRAVAICLAPQNSRTSVGLYREAIYAQLPAGMEMDFVESWHDHPQLIEAFAEKLRKAREAVRAEFGGEVPVVFTAHSVPEKTIEAGDPYATQARETAELVAAKAQLGEPGWRFAFQSQGMSGGTWLGPTVEQTLLALKNEGHRVVLLQPIGFLCDHVEVLYDIDIVFKNFAREHGMELRRTESLNDSALLAEALMGIASERMRQVDATKAAAGSPQRK